MKRKFWLTLTLGVMLLTMFSGLGIAAEPFSIKVQGSGEVRVIPSKVQMWIGVQTDGATAEEALSNNGEAIQKLLSVFNEFSSTEMIKTSEFNMYQKERWDETRHTSVPDGFNVRQVFEVQILDIAKVATFLDRSTAAGANIIYGLQYGAQDYRTPREEAYKRAMEDAWWKGEILAKANNAENLVLESVEESYYYGTEYSSESIALDAKQENVIMPGQLKITASITATFKAELPE